MLGPFFTFGRWGRFRKEMKAIQELSTILEKQILTFTKQKALILFFGQE